MNNFFRILFLWKLASVKPLLLTSRLLEFGSWQILNILKSFTRVIDATIFRASFFAEKTKLSNELLMKKEKTRLKLPVQKEEQTTDEPGPQTNNQENTTADERLHAQEEETAEDGE